MQESCPVATASWKRRHTDTGHTLLQTGGSTPHPTLALIMTSFQQLSFCYSWAFEFST
jgi:hypothetical protein